MPYEMIKNSDGTYRVVNSDTGDVKMKSGSKAEAKRQMRLLYGVEHGWRPTGGRRSFKKRS
jgi:hypothetical protein